MPKSYYCEVNNFKIPYAKDVVYEVVNTFEYNICTNCNSYFSFEKMI